MDSEESYFLYYNKCLEDKIDYCLHRIETRLDKLAQNELASNLVDESESKFNVLLHQQQQQQQASRSPSAFSAFSFQTFKPPYIRDFKGFSPPANEDVRQIKQLRGTEDIDLLLSHKTWSKEAKQQLRDAVLDYYARKHLLKLIKQKNLLLESSLKAYDDDNEKDVVQKLRLIDEQTEQVKARKEPRIFVPEDRLDSQIDWCAISAQLGNGSQHGAHDCKLMWSNSLHSCINNNMWTKDEDICLIDLVAKHGKNNWDLVAQELNTNRLAWQCCARYQQEYQFITCPISQENIDKILEIINLCRIGNFVPWNQVMFFIQYHNIQQVRYQWHKYCSEKRASVPWSQQEDRLLVQAVERFGEKDWGRVADCLPGRTNKSCRERFIVRLKSETRAIGKWRPYEDRKLLSLVETFGTNWSLMSATRQLERNAHQLRNRFELLKDGNQRPRAGPIKRKQLYKNSDGQMVCWKRKRPASELEVNQKLYEIFSTYRTLDSSASKSLVCRSAQDETIYRRLTQVLSDILMERRDEAEEKGQLLDKILFRAVDAKSGLLTPCAATIRGFKAWTLQQDYLSQFSRNGGDDDDDLEVDNQFMKIIVSIFLWPALLSRLKPPELDTSAYLVGSLIERDTKNLYKVRNIQQQITR